MLQMACAYRIRFSCLRRLLGVRKIQQAIALPDLRCYRELALHDGDHVGAIDRQLGVLRQNPIDRTAAMVANLESWIVEAAYHAVEAPR